MSTKREDLRVALPYLMLGSGKDWRPASVADLVAVGESLGGWVTMWHAEDWDEPRRVLILPLDEQ